MNIEKFGDKYGNIRSQGGYFTYEPKELPFKNLNSLLDVKIINLMGEVSFSLGRLDNYVSKIENADLLLEPYLKKESLSSSKIEGTRTTLDQVFLSERKKSVETEDSEEVLNYSKALNQGLSDIKEKNIDEDLIKKMHNTLMKNVRGENKDPGKFKTAPNWIGGIDLNDAEFVPSHPSSVNNLMKNLISYSNEKDNNAF